MSLKRSKNNIKPLAEEQDNEFVFEYDGDGDGDGYDDDNEEQQYDDDEDFEDVHGKTTHTPPIQSKQKNNDSKKILTLPTKENNYNQLPSINKQKQSSESIRDSLKTKNNNNGHEQQQVVSHEQLSSLSGLGKAQHPSNKAIINNNDVHDSFKSLKSIEQSDQSNELLSTPSRLSRQKQVITKNHESPEQMNESQLIKTFEEREKTIRELRASIEEKRAEIKKIGQIVDRSIEKNIAKISKNKNPLSIKELFSANSKEIKNQKVKALKEELQKYRTQAKIMKEEVTNEQNKVSDPLALENIEKSQELQYKLKSLTNECTAQKTERDLLNKEVIRMRDAIGIKEKEETDKTIQKNRMLLAKIYSDIKEERNKLYITEKEDIILTEKMKFINEQDYYYTKEREIKNNNNSNNNNNKIESSSAAEILDLEEQIKELVESINFLRNEKLQTEYDRSRTIKNLLAETEKMEKVNETLISQIREVDSELLHFYSYKASRKSSSKVRDTPKTAEKSRTVLYEADSPFVESKAVFNNDKNLENFNSQPNPTVIANPTANSKFRSRIRKNSQNRSTFEADIQVAEEDLEPQPQNVEKKKTYEFGDLKVDQKGAILSDEILGRVMLRELTIFTCEDTFYGIQAKYYNAESAEITGMKICEKNSEVKCSNKYSMILEGHYNNNTNNNDNNNDDDADEITERLENIVFGFSSEGEVKYIEFLTSKGKKLEWGSKEKCKKINSQHIEPYESITIKAKLVNTENDDVSQQQQQTFPSPLETEKPIRPKLRAEGVGFNIVFQQGA